MRVRIWPILLIGFGALLVLIASSGLTALQRASAGYGQISELYRRGLRTDELLGDLRSDIQLSAITVRDILLAPGTDHEADRTTLVRLEADARRSLEGLRGLLPPDSDPRLRELTAGVIAYFALTKPEPREPEGRRLTSDLLLRHIYPQRQAVLAIAGEISELTRESLRQRRLEIDRREGELPPYVARLVGLTLLVAFVVAGASLYNIRRLEAAWARQHLTVQQAEDELRRLSQRLVRAQEEERRSISRDLHDQIGQVLTAVRIGIGNVEDALSDTARVHSEIDQARRLCEQAMRSVRDLAMGLRPAMLDDLGLGPALQWQARQVSRVASMPVNVHLQGAIEDLSDAERTCVYRVVQEALNNVVRHASATTCDILVESRAAAISVEVRDNGNGFVYSKRAERGLGLLGIKERVRQLGGDMTIVSSPGEGTVLRAHIPFRANLEAA